MGVRHRWALDEGEGVRVGMGVRKGPMDDNMGSTQSGKRESGVRVTKAVQIWGRGAAIASESFKLPSLSIIGITSTEDCHIERIDDVIPREKQTGVNYRRQLEA